MSFNIALSGIAAAKKDLDVTANNIANVGTIGFKESRAEFADVYADSLFSNSNTKSGDGVTTASVTQQFHQGSLAFTDNALDLAITGSGFFVTSDSLDSDNLTYTRAGAFQLDDNNYIVDSSGNYLQTYPVNADGSSSSLTLASTNEVQIPETAGTPVETTIIDMTVNLGVDDPTNLGLDVSAFDINDLETYNHKTSVPIYDSLGVQHTQTSFFVKDDSALNQWAVFTAVDGIQVNAVPTTPVPATATTVGLTAATAGTGHVGAVLTFDEDGLYIAPENSQIQLESLGAAGVLTSGADGTQAISLSLEDSTQYLSDDFALNSLDQNGLTVGRLTGVEIGPDGLILAKYSNGNSEPLARVAMARFRNEQGLNQIGNTSWTETQQSGNAIAGEADSGTYGGIKSAALEQANVDLTTELVDLIAAQRNFQANSRALEVNQTLSQTILQIR